MIPNHESATSVAASGPPLRRRIRIGIIIALVVLAVEASLGFVPYWPSHISLSATTQCSGVASCRQSVVYLPICGPFCGRFVGSWSTDGLAGQVYFAVAFGDLPKPGCTTGCPGVTYSTPNGQVADSFDVRYPLGHWGSIYVIMVGLESNNATVTTSGTSYSPPL
jgi:hypothetical protein